MKNQFSYVLSALLLLGLIGCSSDDTLTPSNGLAPEVSLNITESQLSLFTGDTLTFVAKNSNQSTYQEAWSLGDSVVSTTAEFNFIPQHQGDYSLTYNATNDAGQYTYQYQIAVSVKLRPVTDSSIAYVSELIEYLPAPGQFINTNLGNTESAKAILGKKGGMVSLGAWGGSATYQFDHSVINRENQNDLIIYGNAMPTFAEPGIIWVMQDENGNGLADDTWYQIKGSAHELEGSALQYSVTYHRPENPADDVPWEDNLGNSGVVETNQFHQQAYYPEWLEADSYTLTGTLLPSDNIDMSNPSYITSAPFEYGYADNTVGGDKIDLADAVDINGQPVTLQAIDFIKIQTAVQANMGWLGELSTEITGIADLSLIGE